MKTLRIAFLTDYLGTLAGTEASLVGTVQELRRHGHEVIVAVFPRDDPIHPYWRDVLAREGVRMIVPSGTCERTFCRDVAAAVTAWQPDLIHAIPMGQLLRTWLGEGCLPSVPCVATETSEASERCFWYDPGTFAALAAVSAVIAPCRRVAEGVRGLFGYRGRIEVLPHLLRVPEDSIRPLAPDDLVTLPSIGAITRLRVEKGPEFLLAALALLIARRPAATLTVHGEMPERERAIEVAAGLGISRHLSLAGPFHGDDDIDRVLRPHCVTALSSLFEGFPLAILHAMARGRVVVATEVGGVRDLLSPRDNGVIVPVADTRAMADAFAMLLDDPALVLRKSAAAVATFRDSFHSDRVVPRQIAFYREIAG